MSEIKYVCAVCGGSEVQHAMWVSLNDGAVVDDFGSWCDGDNSWCDACEEHVEIKVVDTEKLTIAQRRDLRRLLGKRAPLRVATGEKLVEAGLALRAGGYSFVSRGVQKWAHEYKLTDAGRAEALGAIRQYEAGVELSGDRRS